jgi:hypothetical protein
MKLTPHLGSRFLEDSFPLPLHRPFSTTQAVAVGLGHHDLRRLVTDGYLKRPLKGVYVDPRVPDSVDLRCACLALVVPPHCVVVDRHAGWLHGATMVLRPGEHLDLEPIAMFVPPRATRLRNGLAASGERHLLPRDLMEVNGLRVTTPLRTALDLGRARWLERALAGMDQMLRLGAFSHSELIAEVQRFRGMRWVRTLRAMAPYADGRAESPPESVLRLRWIQAGLPAPKPQYEVWRGAEFVARLDIADDELMFAAEYDGDEWHAKPEQIEHDRGRRTEAEEEGWLIEVFTKDNLFGPGENAEALLRAGATRARGRFGIRAHL